MTNTEQFESDIKELGRKHGLTRVKTEALNFDHDFKLSDSGQLALVKTKAVTITLGKTTKTPIGESETHKTFEEAEKAARAYWSAYFKKRRESRSDKEKRAEAKRQKVYRDRRQLKQKAFIRQQ